MSVVDPVFVDRSGRRRRLFTILGAGLGVLLAAGSLLLVAGLMGSSPVPLPGLPQSGQGGQHRDGAGTAPGHTSAPPRPSRTATPAAGSGTKPGSSLPPPSSSLPVSLSPSDPHDNRKTAHPGNAKPSRTK